MLNRSSRAGEREQSAGGAEEATESSRVGAVAPHRRRDPGTVVVRAGPHPWNGWRLGLGLRSDGHQCREGVNKEPDCQTIQPKGGAEQGSWV